MPAPAQIPAARVPVTSTYHGVDVTEDYRWLEDRSAEETVAWTRAQQERTRAYLDAIPWRGDLRARIERLLRDDATSYQGLASGGDRFFALKDQKPHQRPFLVMLTDLDDAGTERVVVDPTALDASGETTIDWFVPSPDGSRVAVSLSEHGDEDGTLHVYDVDSGSEVCTPIAHVNVMGGSTAWRADGGGLWYTLPGDPEGFQQQVWFRDLTTSTDRLDLDGPFADPRIAENFLTSSPDGRWVLDRVQKGDGGEWQAFVRSQEGPWWQVADLADRCVLAVLGDDDALYLLSRRDAPRGKVLRLALRPGATVADATEIVATGERVIDDLAVTGGIIWVVDLDGGPQQVRRFDLHGARSPGWSCPRSPRSRGTADGWPGCGRTWWPGCGAPTPSRAGGGPRPMTETLVPRPWPRRRRSTSRATG